MKSLTKNEQNEDTLRAMTERHFHPLALQRFTALKKGYFNAAYEIVLSNGVHTIVKVAPSQQTRVMTYEHNLMDAEVGIMRDLERHPEIPAPRVLAYDRSRTICSSPYFFMDKIPGSSLDEVRNSFTPRQLEDITGQLGKINSIINNISYHHFGYPAQPEFQGTRWYTVFVNMLQTGIADAQHAHINLNIDIGELLSYLRRDEQIFTEVTKPRLVHWDCWDGNIFVNNGHISGIIDWERSLWADPLMEVGFSRYACNSRFLAGYGIEKLTHQQIRRMRWYDIYRMILVSLECEYRQYETLDMYLWSTDILQRCMSELSADTCEE